MLPTYGLTEAASQVATLLPEELARHLGSAGRPLPPTEIRIERDGRYAGNQRERRTGQRHERRVGRAEAPGDGREYGTTEQQRYDDLEDFHRPSGTLWDRLDDIPASGEAEMGMGAV